jgi:membrane protease YdiL (CAAX protease family)
MFLGLYLTAILGAWGWAIGRLRQGRPLLEQEPRRARPLPWGGLAVVMLVLLYFAVSKGIAELIDPYIRGAHAPHLSPADDGTDAVALEKMVLSALINVVMIVLMPLALAVGTGATRHDLGLGVDRRTLRLDVVRGIVACLLVSPIVYGMQFAALQIWKKREHPVQQMLSGHLSAPVVVLAFLSAVLLAPVAEELLFRGVLMGWLIDLWDRIDRAKRSKPAAELMEPESAPLPEPTAGPGPEADGGAGEGTAAPPDRPRSLAARVMPNLTTSLIFAWVHAQQWPDPVAIFLLSLALGFLYQRTGRLVAPIVLHATFNGVSTVVALSAAN